MLDKTKISLNTSTPQLVLPQDVPVFNLEVLIARCDETGMYRARLANLEGESFVKATPRDAISAIVTSAKKVIRELVSQGETIPWLVPSASKTVEETLMLVPVHL